VLAVVAEPLAPDADVAALLAEVAAAFWLASASVARVVAVLAWPVDVLALVAAPLADVAAAFLLDSAAAALSAPAVAALLVEAFSELFSTFCEFCALTTAGSAASSASARSSKFVGSVLVGTGVGIAGTVIVM
jgi:hypothetical protein